MEYSKDIARKICEEMGIEWDEEALVPTVNGVPTKPEDILNLFKISNE